MYDFLKRNGFPMCELLGVWYNETQLVEEIKRKGVFQSAEEWPLFLKACHLTQSSSKATRTLIDMESTLSEINDITDWIHRKYVQIAELMEAMSLSLWTARCATLM